VTIPCAREVKAGSAICHLKETDNSRIAMRQFTFPLIFSGYIIASCSIIGSQRLRRVVSRRWCTM